MCPYFVFQLVLYNLECYRELKVIGLTTHLLLDSPLPDLSQGDFISSYTEKNPPAMQETWAQFLAWKDPLKKGMATHSSILAWRIPWTEQSGGLLSVGSQRVRHA